MTDKPTILFIAITPSEYDPAGVRDYGAEHTFELIPHKHSVLALVGWLRENGCEGHYVWVDPGDEESPSRIEKAMDALEPDALGFSLVTEELLSHYRIIELLKERHPNLPVIVGGPHVSAEPVHTLEHFPLIDFVAIGEGEKTLTEWLKAIASGRGLNEMREVDGLAFRDESGEIAITSPRGKFADINILPDPAFDLIVDPHARFDQRSAFPLICSYGCPFFCTFCAADHGNYRFMAPGRVVNQIERAQEDFGVEYFAIRDSFWPPSGEWLDEFCDEVERHGLKFQFHFETRVGTLTEKQWARLKRIGAQAVGVGVESGDPEILKAIKKAITVDMARKTFAALHKAGIVSVAFFMFGNQGENRESIKASTDLAHELNPAFLSLATFRPLPGTEAYKFVSDHDKDWWMRRTYPSICELTTEELNHARVDLHIRYPLRWAYLWQHVFSSRLPPEHRELCWRAFWVHMRKYVIGMLERFAFMRGPIRGARSILRP